MWLLYLLTICNSLLNQHTFVNVYRLEFGFVLIGVFEVLAVVGLTYALVKGGDFAAQYPTLRTSPVLVLVMSLYLAGFLAGVFGGFLNDITPKELLVNMREFAMFPLCIFIGYRMLATPRAAEKFIYAMAIGGVLTSMMMFISFGENADYAGRHEIYGLLRGVSYVANYASIGAALMLFLILADIPLIPFWLSVAIACICAVASFANFSRTIIVSLVAGVVMLLPVLPRQKTGKIIFRTLLLVPLSIAVMYVALYVASRATGRDIFTRFNDTLSSLMPWTPTRAGEYKAWETRLPSILIELKMWAQSPLWGQGFAAQVASVRQGAWDTGGFDQNAWTGMLAKTGIFGFTALLLTMTAPIVMGYRMIKSRLDRPTMAMGGLAYIVGINGFVSATCTMTVHTRAAMLFALVAGIAFRARAMQEATIAMQQQGFPVVLDSDQPEMLDYTYAHDAEERMHPMPMPISEPEALAHFHRL